MLLPLDDDGVDGLLKSMLVMLFGVAIFWDEASCFTGGREILHFAFWFGQKIAWSYSTERYSS